MQNILYYCTLYSLLDDGCISISSQILIAIIIIIQQQTINTIYYGFGFNSFEMPENSQLFLFIIFIYVIMIIAATAAAAANKFIIKFFLHS